MRRAVVDVAVSVVQAPDGRVLMAERTATQISPGFWELPGGKIDPGETAPQAAARELAEEIGITALSLRPLISYRHAFRLRDIRLFFFRVERWSGVQHGREGQRLAWVDPAHPSVTPILPSNERILAALGLPAIYAVSDSVRHGGAGRFLAQLERGLQEGLRLVQLREPAMTPDQRVQFSRRVAALAEGYGARVVIAGSALEARRAGLDAAHSAAAELRRLQSRPQVRLWTASCHDEAELRRAEQLGADAVVISPIFASAAHPERRPLGWEGLRSLAASASIPLFAQGGLSPALLPEARQAGAVGIATSDWRCGAEADIHDK